jgi:hypothetical protein
MIQIAELINHSVNGNVKINIMATIKKAQTGKQLPILDSLRKKNSSILDKQYERQAQAVSKSKSKLGIKPLKAGGMLKRADGSYSKRGLWDNIRAAKGSGKKPTAQMLKQEKKIKAKTKK